MFVFPQTPFPRSEKSTAIKIRKVFHNFKKINAIFVAENQPTDEKIKYHRFNLRPRAGRLLFMHFRKAGPLYELRRRRLSGAGRHP